MQICQSYKTKYDEEIRQKNYIRVSVLFDIETNFIYVRMLLVFIVMPITVDFLVFSGFVIFVVVGIVVFAVFISLVEENILNIQNMQMYSSCHIPFFKCRGI